MNTEKKLTAVEQIFEMIENNEISNLSEMKEWFINLEKQQIIDAFEIGNWNGFSREEIKNGKNYYNQTFKNE